MDFKKLACRPAVAVMLLLLANQANAQVRGATRLALRPTYQIPFAQSPTYSQTFNPAQSVQSQTQSKKTPIQPNAPNGYAMAAPQTRVFNAPIQTNAPNGYAVAAPVLTADPTALCDAKWKTALRREIMNVDDWRCGKKLAADGITWMPCIITGPTSDSVFKNSSACGWKNVPPFCDNTAIDLMTTLRQNSTPPSYAIPAGYTTIPGSGSYKVHTEVVTWEEARAICRSEGVGVDLAVPSKLADYQAILGLVNIALPTQTKGLFVGISDTAVEGTFVAVTGQPLCMFEDILFLAGEPNNGGIGEDCLQIGYLKGLVLNDISCTSPLPFVCEQTLPELMGPCP